MDPPFAELTVCWMSLISGAAHATAALRSLARDAPEAEPEFEPERKARQPAQSSVRSRGRPAAKSARTRQSGAA